MTLLSQIDLARELVEALRDSEDNDAAAIVEQLVDDYEKALERIDSLTSKPAPEEEPAATDGPQVLRETLVCLQVCVPAGWDDEQVSDWATRERPPGTQRGYWTCRQKAGNGPTGPVDERGDLLRVPCHEKPAYHHVVLEC